MLGAGVRGAREAERGGIEAWSQTPQKLKSRDCLKVQDMALEAEETQAGRSPGWGSQRPRESFGKVSSQLWVLLLRMREEWALSWLTEPVAVTPLHASPKDSEVPSVSEPLVVVERELRVG